MATHMPDNLLSRWHAFCITDEWFSIEEILMPNVLCENKRTNDDALLFYIRETANQLLRVNCERQKFLALAYRTKNKTGSKCSKHAIHHHNVEEMLSNYFLQMKRYDAEYLQYGYAYLELLCRDAWDMMEPLFPLWNDHKLHQESNGTVIHTKPSIFFSWLISLLMEFRALVLFGGRVELSLNPRDRSTSFSLTASTPEICDERALQRLFAVFANSNTLVEEPVYLEKLMPSDIASYNIRLMDTSTEYDPNDLILTETVLQLTINFS